MNDVEEMAKNFALVTDRPRVEFLLQKYGREFLLQMFEPYLKKFEFWQAQRLLQLLRGEIVIEEYLD